MNKTPHLIHKVLQKMENDFQFLVFHFQIEFWGSLRLDQFCKMIPKRFHIAFKIQNYKKN